MPPPPPPLRSGPGRPKDIPIRPDRAYAAAGENDLAHQELETCQRLTPVDQDDADARKFALAALASWPHPIPDTL